MMGNLNYIYFCYISVTGENTLCSDPANLMFLIPVDTEEQSETLIPEEDDMVNIVCNTNECEWKISSAYTLSQQSIFEDQDETNWRECIEDRRHIPLVHEGSFEGILKTPIECEEISKLKRHIKGTLQEGDGLDEQSPMMKNVVVTEKNLSRNAKGLPVTPQNVCLKKDTIPGKQPFGSNFYKCKVGRGKKVKKKSKPKIQSNRKVSSKRQTTSVVSSKEDFKKPANCISNDKIVKPIRKGLFRYDFRTSQRRCKQSAKRKVCIPVAPPPKVSKVPQISQRKHKESDLNTKMIQAKCNDNGDMVSELSLETIGNKDKESMKGKTISQIIHPPHCLVYQERKEKCTYCLDNSEVKSAIEPVNTKCKICNVFLCKSIWRKGGRSCFERYHQERAKLITDTAVGPSSSKEEKMSVHYPVNINRYHDSRKKKVCEICYAKKSRGEIEGSTFTGYKCSVCSVGLCARDKTCFKEYHNLLFETNPNFSGST